VTEKTEKFEGFCHILETTLDCDEYGIPPDAETYSDIIWYKDTKKCSESEFNAAFTAYNNDYESKQYQRDRLTEYPSIQELVVALYDEEDKQAIIEKRNAVKAKYPKPE